MADNRRSIRRIQQRNAGNIPVRVFRDRLNPLEVYSEDEIFARYRFRPHSIGYGENKNLLNVDSLG